jgi:hypothetical protein
LADEGLTRFRVARLSGRPDDTHVVLARNALRVLPALARLFEHRIPRSETRDAIALGLFRFLIRLTVAGDRPESAPAVAAAHDAFSISLADHMETFEFRFGAMTAAARHIEGRLAPEPALEISFDRTQRYFEGAASVDSDRQGFEPDDLAIFAADALGRAWDTDIANLTAPARYRHFGTSLWPDGEPNGVRQRLADLWARLGDAEAFAFWRDWYEGYLNGRPLDWDLQLAVAGIPDADWERGPAHLARCIEERRARLGLRAAVAAAEADLRRSGASRFGIGGNHPPEPIGDAGAEVPDALVFVSEPLRRLRDETDAPEPDADRVRSAIDQLKAALARGLAWIGGKIDLAIDTTIKWGIPAVGGGFFALNPDRLEAVVRAAETWITYLR